MANTSPTDPSAYVRNMKSATTMTTFATNTQRTDMFFAVVVAFCADFFGGARQGGYPPSPPTALAGRRR